MAVIVLVNAIVYSYSSSAADGVTDVCRTFVADTSGGVITLGLGMMNQGSLSVHVDWKVVLDYGVGVVFNGDQAFDIAPGQVLHPTFKFAVSSSQDQQVNNNPFPHVTSTTLYSATWFTFQKQSVTIGLGNTLPVC